ncbi:hypothetical protein M427DRAFT_113195 [Gonapodya prolifera JEL478]|uniref:Chromatin modification-related protein n=1 Tax=Gonapodya prolifera (strain JEL478) TaxID=1344416 RepID=A0A139AAA0_GONPJ|nr:hypothetical protein M427DRAFT_113195 [Gonapodya prolifera JEL478]|eukprot:KXS13657.1 hypothetical protein M427DRAFT_113195 [Gonapodya prolifera JEL478]
MTTFDSQAFLEEYVSTVENLPSEVSHHFAELRAKDQKFQELRRQISYQQQSVLSRDEKPVTNLTEEGQPQGQEQREAPATNPDEGGAASEQLQGTYETAKNLVKDKVELADKTLSLLETHLRRLDTELFRYQNEDGQAVGHTLAMMSHSNPTPQAVPYVSDVESQADQDPGGSYDPRYRDDRVYKKKRASGTRVSSRKKRKRDYEESDEDFEDEVSEAGSTQGAEEAAEDEPLYCICKNVSYGEMIGCDSENCPIEWFHYECVGLTEPPHGKWYCPLCRGKHGYRKKFRNPAGGAE